MSAIRISFCRPSMPTPSALDIIEHAPEHDIYTISVYDSRRNRIVNGTDQDSSEREDGERDKYALDWVH